MQKDTHTPPGAGKNNKVVFFSILAVAAVALVLLLIWLAGEIGVIVKPGGEGSGFSSESQPNVSSPPEGPAELIALVDSYIETLQSTQQLTVTAAGQSTTLSAKDAKAPVDFSALAALLVQGGHDSALLTEYKKLAQPPLAADSDYVKAQLEELLALVSAGTDTSFVVEKSGVKIIRGSTRTVFDLDAAVSQAEKALNTFDYSAVTLETTEAAPAPLDMEALKSAAFIAAEDARYELDANNQTQLLPHKDGRDVDLEAIQKGLASENWPERVFPFRIIAASVTTDQVAGTLFQDELGKSVTYYAESAVNRTVNVKLATNAVNGVIILPGKDFSFNKSVGQRTRERGFKEAIIYAGDGMVDSLGGGICQISSGLYVAALNAEMQQVNRYYHGYTVAYVPLGMDATVYWGSLDYVFRNNTKHPIKIVASAQNGVSTIKILGTREGPKRTIKFETKVIETIPQNMVERLDPTKPTGYSAVQSRGSSGYKTETYKYVLVDGKVVESILINKSHYKPLQGLVIVGPAVQTTVPPATTPAPETTPPQVTTPPVTTPPVTTLPPETTPAPTTPAPGTTSEPTEPPEASE